MNNTKKLKHYYYKIMIKLENKCLIENLFTTFKNITTNMQNWKTTCIVHMNHNKVSKPHKKIQLREYSDENSVQDSFYKKCIFCCICQKQDTYILQPFIHCQGKKNTDTVCILFIRPVIPRYRLEITFYLHFFHVSSGIFYIKG